jgi:hypothetical protein
MKRFWLVLLSLGLIAAFSTSALAVDVQFSGSLYEAGIYLDKVGLVKNAGTGDKSFSTAFFYQRLRVRTDFIAAPGVKVVTRADILERVWGGARTAPDQGFSDGGGGLFGSRQNAYSAGTQAENENIAFDWAYIEYASPIGIFRVGLQDDGPWGTVFGDTQFANPRILWLGTFGNFTFLAGAVKLTENSYSVENPTGTQSDKDNDKYAVAGLYAASWGQVGILGGYWRYAGLRIPTPDTSSYNASFYGLLPYAIVQIGPVKVQAELDYVWGDLLKAEVGSGAPYPNMKLSNITGWIDATVALGPVYFGGTFAYVSGDDPRTTDKAEGGVLSGGRDWNPCLLMFNFEDRGRWIGGIQGAASGPGYLSDAGQGVKNAFFYQGKLGVKPTPKIDVYATLTYAAVDQKQDAPSVLNGNITSTGSSYGWEIDVVGTYKITNNLSYMLGGAYWFVGDYYKGGSYGTIDVNNDFLLINKLTLTF